MIGQCWGKVNVENCTMNVDIVTGKEYSAGYVGKHSGMLNISGCTVGGTIKTSAKYAAGFVSNPNSSCNITDCLSSLTINSSVNGDGTHGGFVSVQNKTNGAVLNITGCAFNGRLLGSDTNSCGGFVGWRNKGLTITDSIFAPSSVTISDTNSAMFARNLGTTINSYYLNAFGTDSDNQWKQGYSVTAGENTTVSPGDSTTQYKVSKIEAYDKGITFNGTFYAGENENVSLTLGDVHPIGMICGSYSVNNGTLTGNDYPYTLTMPAANVIVTANLITSPYHVGDVNRDLNINIKDVTMIQRYLAQLITLDDDQLALANTNGDYTITIKDVTLLQRYIANYNVELGILTPPTTESPTVPTTEPLSDGNTVRFVDVLNWGKAYLLAYDSNGNNLCGNWPGTQITDTEVNDFGQTLFIFTIPAGAASIVLNNGSDEQTEAIDFFNVDGYYCLGETNDNGELIVEWWKESE